MAINEEKYRRMELRKKTGTRIISSPVAIRSGADYAMSFACLNCKTSNKRYFNALPCHYPKTMQCPVCREESINLGRNFKTPHKNDLGQWRKINYLIEHGFVFQNIRLDKNNFVSLPYPKTLTEAKAFVLKYKKHAVK